MAGTTARAPYTRRLVPTQYDSAWLAIELMNLQRAIPPGGVRTARVDDTPTNQDFTVLYDATDGPIVVTLPMPEQSKRLLLNLKKIDSSGNAVTLIGTIDGVTNPTLSAQYDGMTIQNDGLTYYTLGGA